MPIRQRKGAIGAAVIRLNEAGIGIDDVAMRRPSLDEVFLTLTGHSAESEDGDGELGEFVPDRGNNSPSGEGKR